MVMVMVMVMVMDTDMVMDMVMRCAIWDLSFGPFKASPLVCVKLKAALFHAAGASGLGF